MMKKHILISVIILLIISCNRKTEFVQSKVSRDVFLIKNPLKDGQLSKINFYRYSSNTSYFIDNLPDPGGFSSEELGNYPEDNLAFFKNYKT